MAFNLNVIQLQVDGILSADNNELTQLRRNRLIKAAVEMYSNDRPEQVTADVTGDGGKYYLISSVLTSFIEGFSRVLEIEYPAQAVTADHVPTMLDSEDWDDDYNNGTARYLFFPNHSPASTETVRVRHTAPYLWTVSAVTTAVNQVAHGLSLNDYVYLDPDDSTWKDAVEQRLATHRVTVVTDADNFTAGVLEVDLPPSDFFAVCNLAASLTCSAIATKYARTNDQTITADVVDNAGRSERFSTQARELMDLYKDQVGLTEESKAREYAAAEFVDVDPVPSWSGSYLYHRER